MFKATHFGRTLIIATLAATPALATAQAAQAAELRVTVGDLSQPAGIKAFNARLGRAARSLCGGVSNADISRMDACREGVRSEVLAQLSNEQRAELTTPQRHMAMGYGAH
jgi:UrcA family protein